MHFALNDFEPHVRAHGDQWTALNVQVTLKPISPNHGKAVTGAEFENPEWLTSVLVWETGELDLDAGRSADGWLVSKHYDLTSSEQLDEVFAELILLLRDGSVPPAAMTSWLNRP